MSGYVKPVVVENNQMFEGVFALESGVVPGYTPYIYWTNQNSGSHSDLRAGVILGQGVTCEHLKITCTFKGKGSIVKWGGCSDPGKMSFSGNAVIFEETQHRNSGETINFSFDNVVFSDGEVTDATHRGSYYVSGTHGDESALNDGTWDIDVQLS